MEKTIKPSIYWVKGVEVIETKEYPLGKALYFAENEAKIKMFPADELTQNINKGDKVDIQISFGNILTLKKTTRLYAKDMKNIMEKTITDTRNDALKKLLENTNLDCLDYQDFETAEALIDNIRTQISEDEIIYYSNAMEYLLRNDASLKDSIDIALEFGYELKDINSELLATLLNRKLMDEELSRIEADINEIYNESEVSND